MAHLLHLAVPAEMARSHPCEGVCEFCFPFLECTCWHVLHKQRPLYNYFDNEIGDVSKHQKENPEETSSSRHPLQCQKPKSETRPFKITPLVLCQTAKQAPQRQQTAKRHHRKHQQLSHLDERTCFSGSKQWPLQHQRKKTTHSHSLFMKQPPKKKKTSPTRHPTVTTAAAGALSKRSKAETKPAPGSREAAGTAETKAKPGSAVPALGVLLRSPTYDFLIWF